MTNTPALTNTLYGSDVSLFSGKVRGYLKYKNIPFKEVAPTYGVVRKVILPRTGKMMIPVVITPDDRFIQDTSCIIDYFERQYTQYPITPSTPKQQLVSALMECYGDEWLVMPAMHYRWQFKRKNLPFILNEFGKAAGNNLPSFANSLLGIPPAILFSSSYQPYFGFNKAIEKAVEKSYEALLDDLNTHFEHHPYLLGNRPCIGDYGLLGPLYAHLYRDPYPGEMMREKAPFVARWVERMEFLDDARYGDFLPNDDIPETLIPILQRMAREQIPVLEETASALDAWYQTHPAARHVPRIIGRHDFTIENASSRRAITPFSYWMFQRALDVYKAVDKDREVVDTLLRQIGALKAFRSPSRCTLVYENFKLKVSAFEHSHSAPRE